MRAVAADDECGGHIEAVAASLECRDHVTATIDGRHQSGLVFDPARGFGDVLDEQALGDVLRHHRDKRVRAVLWRKPQLRQAPAVADDGDRCDAIRDAQERLDESSHIEDLEGPRKDCQRLGMHRLRRVRLDESPPQATAGAFIREKKADRAGANDEDVDVRALVDGHGDESGKSGATMNVTEAGRSASVSRCDAPAMSRSAQRPGQVAHQHPPQRSSCPLLEEAAEHGFVRSGAQIGPGVHVCPHTRNRRPRAAAECP